MLDAAAEPPRWVHRSDPDTAALTIGGLRLAKGRLLAQEYKPPREGRTRNDPADSILPTIIVVVAIAIMIGLGVWQLQAKWKEGLLARYYQAENRCRFLPDGAAPK